MFHLIHYKLSLFLPKKYSHLGHTEEDDLVSKHILIVKVGSFGYLCSLETYKHNNTFFVPFPKNNGHNTFLLAYHSAV